MRNRQENRNERPTDTAQNASILADAVVGRAAPDHEQNVIGMGNINRSFRFNDDSNGPSAVGRIVYPYASFIYGFSNSGVIGDQDNTAARDFTTPVTQELYPITPFARAFVRDVWPVYEQLFSSGTGTRYPVTVSEFVRYFVHVTEAYVHLYSVLQINNLAYHFDWSKVFPFSETVPPYIYDMAQRFGATDVGIAQTWLPRLKRLENKILSPHVVAEVKRLLTPMLSIDLNGRLMFPLRHNPLSMDAAAVLSMENEIDLRLDYLDTELAKAGALFQSFMPFPISGSLPWETSPTPAIDVNRANGWFNSGGHSTLGFGDTGDPTVTDSMVFYTGNHSTLYPTYMYSRHPQPTWGELKMCEMWELMYGVVDNEYQSVGVHNYGRAWIASDDNAYADYDSVTSITPGSEEDRYVVFSDMRFVMSGLEHGRMKPGLVGAEITIEPIERLVRVEAQYVFAAHTIRKLAVDAAGASLRELRYSIAMGVANSLKTGQAL